MTVVTYTANELLVVRTNAQC